MFDTQSILDIISESLDQDCTTLEGVNYYIDDRFTDDKEAMEALKDFSDSDKMQESYGNDFADGILGAVRYMVQSENDSGSPVGITWRLDDPCYIANTILYINTSIVVEKVGSYLSDLEGGIHDYDMVSIDNELTPTQIKQVQALTPDKLSDY